MQVWPFVGPNISNLDVHTELKMTTWGISWPYFISGVQKHVFFFFNWQIWAPQYCIFLPTIRDVLIFNAHLSLFLFERAHILVSYYIVGWVSHHKVKGLWYFLWWNDVWGGGGGWFKHKPRQKMQKFWHFSTRSLTQSINSYGDKIYIYCNPSSTLLLTWVFVCCLVSFQRNNAYLLWNLHFFIFWSPVVSKVTIWMGVTYISFSYWLGM